MPNKKRKFSDIAEEVGIGKVFPDDGIEREFVKINEILDNEIEIQDFKIVPNAFESESLHIRGEFDGNPIQAIGSSDVLIDIFKRINKEKHLPFWTTFIEVQNEEKTRKYLSMK